MGSVPSVGQPTETPVLPRAALSCYAYPSDASFGAAALRTGITAAPVRPPRKARSATLG